MRNWEQTAADERMDSLMRSASDRCNDHAIVDCCPACGSRSVSQTTPIAPAFSVMVGDRAYLHGAFAMLECGQCALWYKSTRPSDSSLEAYYACLPYESYDQSTLFPTDKAILSLVTRCAGNGRILDFGCGAGRLWGQGNRAGEVFGVEINARASEVAASRGVRIITEEAVKSGQYGPFDVIVLSDVYEHLSRPLELMRDLAKQLSPGGTIVVCTGSAAGLSMHFGLQQSWYVRIFGHLHVASRSHFSFIAGLLDAELAAFQIASHYRFHLTKAAMQHARRIVYRAATLCSTMPSFARVARHLPILGRAMRWTFAPAYDYARDHCVVAIRFKG
jgi:2-polyprenyl-3-methyl-5-hydroxy-6-metoxy-1,4-benzoquinol methylase